MSWEIESAIVCIRVCFKSKVYNWYKGEIEKDHEFVGIVVNGISV